MRTNHAFNLGLFLATMAALALGTGYPTAAMADQASSPDADKLAEAVEHLTPEQRLELVEKVTAVSPEARLSVRMINRGYTIDEVRTRLAHLTDSEIEKLAGEPEALEAGAGVGIVVFVLALALVAVLVAWYFMVEDPGTADPPPPPAG